MNRAIIAALLTAVSGCAAPEAERDDTADAAAAPGQPGPFRSADLQALAWLEGRWVGTEPNGNPFVEGYRFINDSTVRTYSFADTVSTTPTDSGTISLRNGEITSGSGAMQWSVQALTAGSVLFVPLRGANNSFTWRRESDDAWSATLTWPAAGADSARSVTYPMRRLGPSS